MQQQLKQRRWNMEIERKFIVKNLPTIIKEYSSCKIEQAYLCTDPDMRIRKKNNEYYLTYKNKGNSMLSREEVEIPLPEVMYKCLKQKTIGNIIKKERYKFPYETFLLEIDIFEEPYKPLILAEVEFPSEELAKAFVPPLWFGKEVTEDLKYRNGYMATKMIIKEDTQEEINDGIELS